MLQKTNECERHKRLRGEKSHLKFFNRIFVIVCYADLERRRKIYGKVNEQYIKENRTNYYKDGQSSNAGKPYLWFV